MEILSVFAYDKYFLSPNINGKLLIQKRCGSIAYKLESCLFCCQPLILVWSLANVDTRYPLSQIHHDLAKYHELARFAPDDNSIDWDAAVYHEVQAAQCGVIEAMVTLARLYLGMNREVLVDYNIQVRKKAAFQYLISHFMIRFYEVLKHRESNTSLRDW